jgi:hypothetical protein
MRSIFCLLFCLGCAATGISKKENKGAGSDPVNHKEAILQKQALIRCHKTGGTRIIKINNVLRCF